jgi:kynurenine formamidase
VLVSDEPSYDELPGGSAWGVFGADDQVGTVNRLDEAAVAHAAGLVRRGAVFSLNWGLEHPDPPLLGRGAVARHHDAQRAGTDDHYDAFYPQSSTHWDALKHVRHPEAGYYNGASTEQVEAPDGTALGIQSWARRGIVGRFVLLDLARLDRATGRSGFRAYDAGDLAEAVRRQGVQLRSGDVLLLRTGWTAWYEQASYEERAAMAAAGEELVTPGLAQDEAVARWLWDHGVAAAAGDAPAFESTPFDQSSVDGFLHYRLIALLGMPLGELFYLEALAEDCAADGVYDGFFSSAPLNLVGGSGSPANALAVK